MLRDLNVPVARVGQEYGNEAQAEIVPLEPWQTETRGLHGIRSRGLRAK